METLQTHGVGAGRCGPAARGLVARARTIRRRRIGLTGVAVATALVGVDALAPLPSGVGGSSTIGAGSPATSATRPGKGVTISMPPSDQPGAADRPDLVATDPGTFHFDVDTAAIGASGISYSSQGGVEAAQAWNPAVGHFNTWYYLAPQRAAIDPRGSLGDNPHDPAVDTQVSGSPATMVRYPSGYDGTHPVDEVTWQPVDGLWARVDVEASDTTAAMNAVFALRLDRSQRCAVPFRLASLPAGYTWTGCDVSFGSSSSWEVGGVWLSDADGHEVGVKIGNLSTGEAFTANATAGDRSAQRLPKSEQPIGTSGTSSTPSQLFIPVRDWVAINISRAETQADAEQLAALVDVSTNFTDRATWPVRPIG